MLPRCWVLGHWHCWEWWRCYWLQSSGHCLRCCCCMAFQGGHRRKRSELEPGAGADYLLGWAWGWWGDWEPGAGWGAGAAAACRSSPPEAGGGSSCEHYGTWFYKTFWRKDRGKRRTGLKRRILKPSVDSPLRPNTESVCVGASSSMTGSTHLPHSLQGKKLANEGTGTASSSPNCLSTGWQMGVICENRTNCKLPCCDRLVELHSTPDKNLMHLTHYTRLHKYSKFFYTTHSLFLFRESYSSGIRMTEHQENRQITTGQQQQEKRER